jgi:hypothetical protein
MILFLGKIPSGGPRTLRGGGQTAPHPLFIYHTTQDLTEIPHGSI